MISFDGARLLQYDHSHEFLGDNFRYATKKNLTIEGSVYKLGNLEGVAPVWSGIQGFVSGAADYDAVVVNGINFGKGRIDSINFSESIDVTKKDYRVSLTTFDAGNLFNASGEYYEDLLPSGIPFHIVEGFNEQFAINLEGKSEGEFTQTVSCRFISGAAANDARSPKQLARELAAHLFDNSPGIQLFGDTYGNRYNLAEKKYFTENYNHITNECTFDMTQLLTTGASTYRFTYTHDINTDQNGITTATEAGLVEGLGLDKYASAQSGYVAESPAMYTRTNAVFEAYKPAGALPLSTQRLEFQRRDNKFEGTIDYSAVYNNDPSFKDTYTWEYSQEITKQEDCMFQIREAGSIKGISVTCAPQDTYANALAGWNTVQNGIATRAADYYNQATSRTKPLKIVSKSEAKSEFRSTVDYGYTYTDDHRIGTDGFKRIEYTVEDSYPVATVNKFNILGVKEIVQPQFNSTEGVRTVNMQLIGYKTHDLADYLAYAKTKINLNKPTGGDVFITDCTYSLTPKDNIFSISTAWTFFGSRAFGSVTL